MGWIGPPRADRRTPDRAPPAAVLRRSTSCVGGEVEAEASIDRYPRRCNALRDSAERRTSSAVARPTACRARPAPRSGPAGKVGKAGIAGLPRPLPRQVESNYTEIGPFRYDSRPAARVGAPAL